MRLLDRIAKRLDARKPGRVLKNTVYPSMRAKRAFLRELRVDHTCVKCGAWGASAKLRFKHPKLKPGERGLYHIVADPKATFEQIGDAALDCTIVCNLHRPRPKRKKQ